MAGGRCHLAILLLLAAVAYQAAAQNGKSITFTDILPGEVYEATGPAGCTPNFTISAQYKRDVPGSPTETAAVDFLSCDPDPSGIFKLGDTSASCTAKRRFLNANNRPENFTSTKEFIITVLDRTPPDTKVPDPIVKEPTGPTTDVPFTVTCKDIVDLNPSVSCKASTGETFNTTNSDLSTSITLPVTLPGAAPTTISCVCIDDYNNQKDKPEEFTITIKDTKPPKITTNSTEIIVEAQDDTGANVDYLAKTELTVTDNSVSGSVNPTCVKTGTTTPAVSGATYPLGTTKVTCSAEDSSKNKATVEITIIVQDTTKPVIDKVDDYTVEATGPDGAFVEVKVPKATDNPPVTKNVNVTCDKADGIYPITDLPYTPVTVKCSAKDNATNAAEDVFYKFTVVDTTKPDMPDNDITIYLDTDTTATFTGFPNEFASDKVDGDKKVPIVCADAPAKNAALPLGKVEVKCTATDKHNNVAEKTYTITVLKPVSGLSIVVPSDESNIEADSPAGKKKTFTVSAADVLTNPTALAITCSTPGGVTLTGAPSSSPAPTSKAAIYTFSDIQFNIQSTTVTCTAKNYLKETVTKTFVIEVVDKTPPTIDIDAPARIPAEPTGTPVTFTTTTFDIVDPKPTVECSPVSGTKLPLGPTIITCNSTDSFKNRNTTSVTVTVYDDVPPTCTPLDNLNVTTIFLNGSNVPYKPSVCTDAIDGNLTVVCDPPSGSLFPVGVTVYSCNATDKSGNTAKVNATITVVDTCVPTIVVPQLVTGEATSETGRDNVTYTVTASNCDGTPLDFSCTPPSGSRFPYDAPSGTVTQTTVTCQTTSPNGVKATGTFPVGIEDTTPPVIDALPDLFGQAGVDNQAEVQFNLPFARDVVDGNVSLSCTRQSGEKFPLGSTVVSCTATDRAGNFASQNFTVTITKKEPPVLTCPTNLEVEPKAGGNYAEVGYSVSATGNTTVTCFVDGKQVGSPVKVSLKPDYSANSVTVKCVASSDANSTCSFDITIKDKTPCTICAKKDIELKACGPYGAEVCEDAVTKASGSDNIAPAHFTATCNWANRASSCNKGRCRFPVGVTVVTCSGSDKAGNVCSTSFKVVVKDKVAPVISACPIRAEATSPNGAPVTINANVWDNVDGKLTPPAVTYTITNKNITIPSFPYTFPLGVTKVTIKATDKSGNTASKTITVTVLDTTCPVVTVKNKVITVTANDKFGAVVNFPTGQCTATDKVTLQPVIKYKPGSGTKFPVGSSYVVCTATDGAGNVGYAKFTVVVEAPRDTCRGLQSHILLSSPTTWMRNDVYSMCGCVEREEKVKACTLCNKVRGGFGYGSHGYNLSVKLHTQLGCGGFRPFRKQL